MWYTYLHMYMRACMCVSARVYAYVSMCSAYAYAYAYAKMYTEHICTSEVYWMVMPKIGAIRVAWLSRQHWCVYVSDTCLHMLHCIQQAKDICICICICAIHTYICIYMFAVHMHTCYTNVHVHAYIQKNLVLDSAHVPHGILNRCCVHMCYTSLHLHMHMCYTDLNGLHPYEVALSCAPSNIGLWCMYECVCSIHRTHIHQCWSWMAITNTCVI
jgi:hypothetical protein